MAAQTPPTAPVGQGGEAPAPPPPRPAPPRPAAAAPPREPQPRTGALSLGIVLVGAGTLWLLAALGVDMPVTVVAPALLLAIGLGLLVAGVRGEDNVVVGLAVFVGVWLAIAAMVSVVLDVPLTGAVGERELMPTSATELVDDSRLFAGRQLLDLRDVELTEGTTDVELSVVLGEVEVVVPEGMAVRVDAATAGGSIDVFDDPVDGLALRHQDETPGWTDASSRLDLHLRVGLGEITVRAP